MALFSSFDSFGQLIRENNQALDKTYVYSYNGIGNITGVQSYSYTTGELSGTPGTTSFGYSDDKLTSFNGSAITYNSNGGVASYDGKDYTWSNGKLTKIRQDLSSSPRAIKPTLSPNKTYSFTYNALGQRVGMGYSYTVDDDSLIPVTGTEVTSYSKKFHYDHMGRLIYETTSKTLYSGENEFTKIVFLYDEGAMVGFEYTSPLNETSIYYYLRNLQGDVIAIYDTNGTLKVKYKYDAWGNCTVASGTTDYTLARENPIRYRGYYYDTGTGLYYLNSRYYSPEWRRFISPDDTAYLDPETPNGLNLYCYCNNDPVNYADPSGHWLATVFDLLSAGVSVIEVVINPLDPLLWAGLAGDLFDLLPIATGVGEAIKGTRIVKKGIELSDDAYDTIRFVKAMDYTDEFADQGAMLRRIGNTSDYHDFTKSNHVDGTNLHTLFKGNGATIYNTRLRVDGLDPVTETIFELKPYNRRNIRKGVKQIVDYKKALGGSHKMIIVLY